METEDIYKNIPLNQIPWIQKIPPNCLLDSINKVIKDFKSIREKIILWRNLPLQGC
ncbi:hypothetical protein [Ancylomarina longa]|uniref:hypothetical protein n=1 Tax=Ancylomarina longa TaxID=2487017 RepID=UPI001ADE040D|nr:hypothetical protein [Ancylomarina longa]